MYIGFSGVSTVTSNGYIMVTVTFGPTAQASRTSHSFLPPDRDFSGDIGDIGDKAVFAGVFAFFLR